MLRKKLGAMVIAAATMLATAASVLPAHAANNPSRSETSFPVSWTVESANCTQIPAGTTVTGSGTMRVVTTTRVDVGGVQHERIDAHAEGSAVDQAGNQYSFRYDNILIIKNSLARPQVFNGLMVDAFGLHGHGPAAMTNGFTADFTEDRDALTAAITPRSVRGDPFAFPDIGGRCDPL